MECFEAIALKPSLRREIAMNKTTQQPLYDDVFLYATGFSGASVEEFPIDDLLDFSNGNFDEEFPLAEEEEEDYEKDSLNSVSSQDGAYDYNSTSFSGAVDFTSDELAVPVDDLENLELEWLSNFVDDSVSESSLLNTVGRERTGISAPNRFEPGRKPAFRKLTCFPSTVPAKPRTKRQRTAGRAWSLGSPSFSESSSSSSSPSSSSGSLTSCQTTELLHNFEEPPAKKLNRKKSVQSGEQGGSQVQRRCSHCHVQKTPQWRAGPLGAKTLCNACGVRYKSGRLLPEYRPACSPTFSGDVHSNSHRKVLEIRRKKEVINGADSGLVQMVSSF